MEEFWVNLDELVFHGVTGIDYNLNIDPYNPENEAYFVVGVRNDYSCLFYSNLYKVYLYTMNIVDNKISFKFNKQILDNDVVNKINNFINQKLLQNT